MSFPLVGNSKIRLALENALKEHHLPHAILIDGDKGTGRHTLAHYLKLAILCSSNNIPCEECEDCRLANIGNHPDVTVVKPEKDKKNISVTQIRELRTEAFIKPHKAQKRVFIIDFAETLNEQSQNALLKVLEEPPESTAFILITESKASLLETILSRCVILSLNAPTLKEGKEYILNISNYSSDDIENALTQSRNNIGKALLLLKGNADSKTSLAAKDFLESAKRSDQWAMLTVLAPFEKSRVETDLLFKDLKLYIIEEIKKNPKAVRASSLLKLYDKVTELEQSLVTNISLSLLFADLTAEAKRLLG